MTIRERLEQQEYMLLAPNAQKAAETKGRLYPAEENEVRTCYQRDADRIVHSKSFRRLMHKTQVFLSPEGDHYRTRMTHTLEVSRIARTICRALRLNEDLAEAAAYGHDLGHTPFGHAGEAALTDMMGTPFHHNEQSLRVVDKLERDGDGLNLTYEVRMAILGHTGSRIPETLEGQVVRTSDRIAYINHDIDDAIRAGFTKVVFIVKPEILGLVRTLCGDSLRGKTTRGGKPLEVCYAFQDFESLPAFYTLPAGRTKPFGTTHAVLCARDYVNEPFCVINADDYYGVDAYRAMYEELQRLPRQGRATMVGYLLKNTASLHGTVSRGVCAVEDGKLRSVREALKIQLYPDGTLRDLAEGTDLSPETVVSMNFWGFAPSIFPALREYFENFLRTEAGENIKAECLLPVMVGDQLQKGALEVSVLHSADKWFGMTYHEDREIVAEELRKLHARGDYPESLRV